MKIGRYPQYMYVYVYVMAYSKCYALPNFLVLPPLACAVNSVIDSTAVPLTMVKLTCRAPHRAPHRAYRKYISPGLADKSEGSKSGFSEI